MEKSSKAGEITDSFTLKSNNVGVEWDIATEMLDQTGSQMSCWYTQRRGYIVYMT